MAPKWTILALACAALLAGCGDSGEGARTDPEKGYDADYLNSALAQEMTNLALYTEAAPRLRGPAAGVLRAMRGHEQEYVDAITKAIRGLGGDTTAEAEAVELPPRPTRKELLELAYQRESEALAASIEAAPRLYTSAPRTLVAALATGHGEHLVVLRRLLGEPLVEAAPEAFDTGEIPPPGDKEPRLGDDVAP